MFPENGAAVDGVDDAKGTGLSSSTFTGTAGAAESGGTLAMGNAEGGATWPATLEGAAGVTAFGDPLTPAAK
jgi:hypothetical protein